MPLKIVRNDITQMQVEAIVNTASARVVVGSGCDSAGTEINYQVLSRAVSRVRACNSVAAIPNALANWDEEIRRDYSQRHSNRK